MARKPLEEAALEYREAYAALVDLHPPDFRATMQELQAMAEYKRLSEAHQALKDAALAECYKCGGDRPGCRCWDDS